MEETDVRQGGYHDDRSALRPEYSAAGGGDRHRGLRPGHRRGGLRQDQGPVPPLRLPGERAGHPAGEHPLRHLHQQVGKRDAPAHPQPDRGQRHRLHQHLPRLLRLRAAGGQPRRPVPQELPGAGQRRHRRHAPDHLRGAGPDPAGHDLLRRPGHDRGAEALQAAGLLPGHDHHVPGHPEGEVRPGDGRPRTSSSTAISTRRRSASAWTTTTSSSSPCTSSRSSRTSGASGSSGWSTS